ncbi:MAG: hypothetical protein V1691_00975 [Chloroflexota bacterium]
MSKRAKMWTAALAIVAVLAVAVTGVALASSPADTDGDTGFYCPGWGYQNGTGMFSGTVSDLLGLTPAQIQDEWQSGKSLVEIAQAQGVGETEMVDAIMADREAAIQDRLTAGTLDQEQADQVLQQMRENVTEMVNSTIGSPADIDRGACGFGPGNGYGQSGLGMGPGMMQRWGQSSGGPRSGGTGFGRGGMMGGWGGYR